MAFEWVAGLFQSEQTRGLSGDSVGSVALDDSNPYYNYRLRRHKAEGDIVADPGLIWYTSPYVKRRTGLGTHVAAEVGEGVANYTDVLLILSAEDHERATRQTSWIANATGALLQEFDGFCRREGFRRLHEHRPIGFRVLCDGSAEMGGKSLALQRGEFVTGLLPNLYTGPGRTSRPVIGVHVNLPGIWEGYREVGRLHNDQILFTLGNYWLDNFSHPSLREAALYRLQQYSDGSFVHIINPDLQDRYQVTSTNQGGASVLTLATRDGEPLAYIVLAVIEAQEAKPAPRPSRPDIAIPAGKPRSQLPMTSPERGDGVPSVAPPMLIDDALQPLPAQADPYVRGRTLGGKTIIPDAPSERIFTFQERGALLQKVHFSAFMLGYDVYVGARGELGTNVESPAATLQVRKKTVSIVAHVGGIKIDGNLVMPGEETLLQRDHVVEVSGQRFEYRDLRGLEIEGWPYVAEIRRPASSTYMIFGEEYQIGRSRECRVVLPDEPRNDNIHWKPSVGDGTTIRARTGDIPKSNFYTDSIMVASKHAIVDVRAEVPKVVCTATHCFVYVRRRGEILSLYPTSRGMLPLEIDVEPGDEVLIGNCVFHVGYTPSGDAVAPSPAPMVLLSEPPVPVDPASTGPFTSDDLVDAVDAPVFDGLDPSTPPLRQRRDTPVTDPEEAPSAYGLGERGVRPRPVPVSRVGMDSILGLPEDEPVHRPPARLAPVVDDADDEPTLTFQGPVEPASPSAAPEDAPPLPEDAPPPPLRDAMQSLPEDAPPLPRPREASAQPSPIEELPPPPPELAPPPPQDPSPVVGTSAAGPARTVVFTDDREAQFELGRPLHLVLCGWMVNGDVVCGNHTGADLVLPENRIVEDQAFEPRDYFRLQIRGRRGELHLLAPTELLVDEDDPRQSSYEDPEAHTIDVIRRDDRGDEDFAVRLTFVEDRKLPDPRARFIAIDTEDPLAAALITKGLPKGAPRRLALGGLELTFFFDGSVVQVTDYLGTYRRDGGFHPFFVQKDGARFKTAPEDGATFAIARGDRLVIGQEVYVLRDE